MISHLAAHPLRIPVSTLKLLAACHYFWTQHYQWADTQGPSMVPTFSVSGDSVLVDLTHARNRRGQLRVGDLVVYRIPISPDANGMKRIIGMPGDYVVAGTPGERGEESMLQVPEGHCWIVGDNLAASRDSRMFGPLPLALIQGKVTAKVFPWAERTWFQNAMQPVRIDG
ncbi:mitochondrial inner membrane protease subunit 1 [Geosmithia morbida]|uniref:Mitochondrial inner membrane protease subunit 1 n=1 Tax=Geosmithia morbida TaxID=1094350 RepID=A0A9P5D1M3_9HYPO|nr:mitochondrial inner membrane protease subunit 1 [Geosmithia morbida]KAF4120616.1 mitochondrial inner membrane protease subunit 1 [Geosmithia morbida]